MSKADADESTAEKQTASESSSGPNCLFTFDAHQYFSFPLDRDPYATSKYGSQVRERKIDRCLKQLQEALKFGKWVRIFNMI